MATVKATEEREERAFAASVVKRLLAKLDEVAEPTVGYEHVKGERVEMRDWLMLHCFGSDHELYDDVKAVLSKGRALS